MNTIEQKMELVKMDIIRCLLFFLGVFPALASCKENTKPQNGTIEHHGYLITSGSGYYFIPLKSTTNYRKDFRHIKSIRGFKININEDSLLKLDIKFDTIIDLNKLEKGFTSAYYIKTITPVKLLFAQKDLIRNDSLEKFSLSIRFDKTEIEIKYSIEEINVLKLQPDRLR